jgi:hypothetical protein
MVRDHPACPVRSVGELAKQQETGVAGDFMLDGLLGQNDSVDGLVMCRAEIKPSSNWKKIEAGLLHNPFGPDVISRCYGQLVEYIVQVQTVHPFSDG